MISNQWVEQIETLRSVNEAMRDNIRAKQKLIDRLAAENVRRAAFCPSRCNDLLGTELERKENGHR